MGGGCHGYRAALAMRQNTPERISSSPGTACRRSRRRYQSETNACTVASSVARHTLGIRGKVDS